MKSQASNSPTLGMSPGEAASYWYVRHDRGALSDDEQDDFDAWLAQSPEHPKRFARMHKAWDLYDNHAADPNFAMHRRIALALPAKSAQRTWRWAGGGLLAASIAVGMMFILPSKTLNPFSPTRTAVASADAGEQVAQPNSTHTTRKGEQRRIRLPDGTAVTLNTDSAVHIAFTPERRIMKLVRGQALFEVAHDRVHPFIVEAVDRQITALGTVFEVRIDPGRMQVMLVEGKVVVDKLSGSLAKLGSIKPTVLTPGQEFVAELGAIQQVSAVDLDTQLRWRDGFVEFVDEPLGEAAAEINRYTTLPVVVPDERAAAMRVSGVFRTGDAARFAAVMEELLPVQSHQKSDRIELVGVVRR